MASTAESGSYVKCAAGRRAACVATITATWALLVAVASAAPAARITAQLAGAQPASSPVATAPGDTRIPRPAALERDVQFWIRVYSEIPTSAGFMHDERNLAIVYETLRFAPDLTPQQRKPTVDAARERYQQLLRRLAAALSADVPAAGPIGEVVDPARAVNGATSAAAVPAGLSEEERRVLALWGPGVTATRLLEASRAVRFQLGQADRFREGLVRSGRWETHIAQSLANLGLPPELAALPHVESSFDPTAYSKVGAAGLWQFMRETGRRYMRIDDEVVDERLDPFRASEAAAQLLAFNYRVLGTWPLALTAYNHGAAGMRRAVEQTGTTDFVTIARNHQSRTFGFASRNFYPSFLAALTIDQNPEKYFGAIQRAPEMRFHEIEMPAYAQIEALIKTLGTSRELLREFNPALREPVWRGERLVPRGYRLRLGAEARPWTPERLAAALGPGELYSAQIRAGSHRVASGETLGRIARRYGITERALAQANGLSVGAPLRRGRRLRLPEIKPPTLAEVELAAVAARVTGAATAASPVSAATVSPSAAASVTPASVDVDAEEPARPRIYRVRAGDTLQEIARRFDLKPSELMRMNNIRDANFLFEGQRLRIGDVRSARLAAGAPGSATASTEPPPAAADASTAAAESEGATAGEERGPATRARVASRSAPPVVPPAPEPTARQVEAAAPVAAAAAAAGPITNTDSAVEPLSPSLGPGAGSAAGAEFADLVVARDDTIRVISEETLGHYAEWLDLPASRLRSLNRLRSGQPVLLGRRLKLDFSRVARADFEQKRRDFHAALQARYFESQRIVGTEIYIVRRGDSAWAVTQRYGGLPTWLLQQYNPDVDLGELRAGTQLIVPRVQGAP
jgi:membrane-bound lytic murein transglycosylase D